MTLAPAGRGRGVLAPALLLLPPVGLLVAFFAYPLALTLETAFASWDPWQWALTHPYVTNRLRVALVQAALSTALTLALACPLAWLYHTRRIRHARWHLALHAAPFVLPVFVVVFGLQALLGSGGWMEALTGADLLAALGPLGAVILAHAYYNYGFAARILHAALARRPHRLEEAARTLGATRAGAFARVTLPLLLPTLLAVALLAFLFAFTSFGVVLFLGGGRVATLETLLYENMGGAFPDIPRAATLGVLQLAINFLLLAGYVALRRRQAALPPEPPRPAHAARPRHVAAAWAFLALALAPAVTVLAGGFRVRGEWTLEPVRALLDAGHPSHLGTFHLGDALANSLFYAAACTVASIALTLLLAYGLRTAGGRWARPVEVLAALPLGTSSLLIGFGYVLAFGAGALLDLRGSTGLVVLAHTLIAFPFTARALLPALAAHDRRLDEAAAVLGAPPLSVVARVHWPLLKGPLLVAAGLAAAVSLGDFGASLLLMREANMGLTVWISMHTGFDPVVRAQALVLTALLMVLTAGAYLLVERFRGGGDADL